jgi:hypothetical protein
MSIVFDAVVCVQVVFGVRVSVSVSVNVWAGACVDLQLSVCMV